MSVVAMKWAFGLKMPGKCKMVLVALANRANDDGECWPSVATVVADTGASERTVQEALRFLETHGAIERRDRPGTSRVYKMTMNAVEAPKNMHPQRFKTSKILAPLQNSHPHDTRTPPPPKLAPHPPQNSHPNPNRTLIEPKEVRTPHTPPVDAAGFDAFWDAYPRKVSKGAARRAWAAAVGKTSPAVILAGLARWQPPSDVKFTPHPATWLNGERWADEEPDNSLDARMNRALGIGTGPPPRTIDAHPANVIPLRLV